LLAFSSSSFFRARLSSFTFSIAARWRRMTVCASSQYAFLFACAVYAQGQRRQATSARMHCSTVFWCLAARGKRQRVPQGCGTCAAAQPAATPRHSRSARRAPRSQSARCNGFGQTILGAPSPRNTRHSERARAPQTQLPRAAPHARAERRAVVQHITAHAKMSRRAPVSRNAARRRRGARQAQPHTP
jgi:hypothetical protein